MSPMAFLSFNALLWCAAASDLRRFRIPNFLPGLLAIAALALDFPASADEALSRTGSLLAVSLVGGALWLRGLLGGGDLKLLMACGLWVPLLGLPQFAAALGLASGLQGAVTLLAVHIQAGSSATLAAGLRRRLPYGLSIAAAGLYWSLSLTPPS